MKRRGGSRKLAKRRRTIGPKARKAPIARVLDNSPKQVDRLKRERDEALRQLAATAEVLRVISSSPGELGRCTGQHLNRPHAFATPSLELYSVTTVACFTR